MFAESPAGDSFKNRLHDSNASPGDFSISEAHAANKSSPCAVAPRAKHATPTDKNPTRAAVEAAAYPPRFIFHCELNLIVETSSIHAPPFAPLPRYQNRSGSKRMSSSSFHTPHLVFETRTPLQMVSPSHIPISVQNHSKHRL